MSETNVSEIPAAEHKVLDLQGDVCPYTLIKSRLALEDVPAGNVLEIRLGNSESAANVPRSLDLEGHEVLSLDRPEPRLWVVRVRRGAQ